MNILQINSSDTGIGGASRVARELHDQYNAGEHAAAFLSGTGTQTAPGFFSVPSQKLRKLYARLRANDLEYFNSDFIFDHSAYKKADVVHFHNVHGWYFNLTTLEKISQEKKVVWTLHDMWPLTPHCAHSPALQPDERGVYQCGSMQDYPSLLWDNSHYLSEKKKDILLQSNITFVLPSYWLHKKVKDSFLSNASAVVIPNGIDTNLYIPTPQNESRRMLRLPLDTPICLFIAAGGLENEFKGGGLIRDLIKALPDTLFVIVGKKDAAIEETHRNVLTVPAVYEQETLAAYYSAANVLLFPSQHDNFPLTILESLACNTPVVASSVGGVPEIIRHKENGYLTDTLTLSGFKDGIQWSLARTNTEQELRTEVVENYSADKMAKSYIELFHAALKAEL